MPHQIIRGLHLAAREASRYASTQLETLALTFEDVLVLRAISEAGRAGQDRVALAADLDQLMVRDIIRDLIRRGLVNRLRRAPPNRRGLQLTSLGVDVLEQAEQVLDQAGEHFRNRLCSPLHHNLARDMRDVLRFICGDQPGQLESS